MCKRNQETVLFVREKASQHEYKLHRVNEYSSIFKHDSHDIPSSHR